MKTITLFTTVLLLLSFIGATAQTIDPTLYGTFLFGDPIAGNSWTQRIWDNVYGTKITHFQFRICTAPDPNYPQYFEIPAFKISYYGVPGDPTPLWNQNYDTYNGVNDALLWASGPPSPSSQGQFLWLTFKQGTVSSYPNPYTSTWFDTPPFVLQMQSYGYKSKDPLQTQYRVSNVEWYFDGTNWGGGTSISKPGVTYASGTSPGNCPEWTLNQPIPEPGTFILLGFGLLGLAGLSRKKLFKK